MNETQETGAMADEPASREEVAEAVGAVVSAFRDSWLPPERVWGEVDGPARSAEHGVYLRKREEALDAVLDFTLAALRPAATSTGLLFESDRVMGELRAKHRATTGGILEVRAERRGGFLGPDA